jgi:hypothetical protein
MIMKFVTESGPGFYLGGGGRGGRGGYGPLLECRMTFLLGSLLYLSSGLSLATISPKKLMYLHKKNTHFQIIALQFTFPTHHFITLLVIMLSSIQTWKNLPISSHLAVHCKNTIPKIRSQYSQERNCAASVPISQFPHSWICERFIYSQDRSALDRSFLGIYKSLTET